MEIRDLRSRLAGDVVLPGDETGTRRDRRGTSPSTSDRSPSCTPSQPTTSRRPSRSPRSTASGSPSTPVATTPARSPGPSPPAAQDRADDGDPDRPRARRARLEAGVLSTSPSPPRPGSTGSRIWPGRPRMSACVGYTLGAGSAGWCASTGWPATASCRPSSCTADGQPVRADAETSPTLLGDPRRRWQLRAVTALEVELIRPEIYAGGLFWPIERAAEILTGSGHDRDCPGAMHVPRADAEAPRRSVPPRAPARPRFVMVELAFTGSAADGEALVRPLRTSLPSSTRSGPCRRRTSASSTWTRPTRCPTRARGSC